MKIKAFYSDPHFGHFNIIRFCNRPFKDAVHMTEGLIHSYNTMINDDDTVVWTGDAFFCSWPERKQIMNLLKGKKILVRGNHDKGTLQNYLDIGFELVIDSWMMLEIEGVQIRACHFPYAHEDPFVDTRYIDKRPPIVEGEILIHGHTHSPQKVKNRMIHVGVDAWNYYPALYEDVAKLVKEINNGV